MKFSFAIVPDAEDMRRRGNPNFKCFLRLNGATAFLYGSCLGTENPSCVVIVNDAHCQGEPLNFLARRYYMLATEKGAVVPSVLTSSISEIAEKEN